MESRIESVPRGFMPKTSYAWSPTRADADERHPRKVSPSFDRETWFPSKRRRLHEETHTDVQCCRQQLESERLYSRRLKERLDDLRRENDETRSIENSRLRYELCAIQQENDNLRKSLCSSRRFEQEVMHLRRENDELRNRGNHYEQNAVANDRPFQDCHSLGNVQAEQRVKHLRWQLEAVAKERDLLLRDMERLKGQMKVLESNSATSASIGTNRNMQRRLDEALCENKTLNSLLQHTKQQVNDLKSQEKAIGCNRKKSRDQGRSEKTLSTLLKHAQTQVDFFKSQIECMSTDVVNLKTENESLQEEMEQMRMNHALELGFAEGK